MGQPHIGDKNVIKTPVQAAPTVQMMIGIFQGEEAPTPRSELGIGKIVILYFFGFGLARQELQFVGLS